MSVFEKMRFSVHVGLVARRQKIWNSIWGRGFVKYPEIIRCASRGKVTVYKIRGSKKTWEIRAEIWDYEMGKVQSGTDKGSSKEETIPRPPEQNWRQVGWNAIPETLRDRHEPAKGKSH